MVDKKYRKQEAAANYFANCLLMPAEMFVTEYEKVSLLIEDERIKILAKVFDVPEWAITTRIIELKELLFR